MNRLLITFLLLAPLFAFADKHADTISKLPSAGYLLQNGWRFHAGDKQEWASPLFNDHNWEDISPDQVIQDLPQVKHAQIGWFRLKFHVADSLKGKTIALAIRQIGASEIYVNGSLLKRYGKVSANYKDEETYNPLLQPLTVQLNGQAEQVLAIRYSFNKQNWYTGTGRTVLSVRISHPDDAWDVYNTRLNRHAHRSFVFGVFFILTILHFSIYQAYKIRRLNLYLACFTFLQAITFIDGLMISWHSNSQYEISRALFYLAAPVTFVYLLFMVYGLFGYSRTIWVKVLVFLALPITIFQLFTNFGDTVQAAYAVIVYIDTIRIAVRALRDRKSGATLLLIGQVTALIFFCSFNIALYTNVGSYVTNLVLVDLAFLPPAIVISILLAREFAQNNFALQLQLKQVEALSEKNLAQEQEKQLILASQNEMLEQKVNERTSELDRSLTHLKATQAQLIQSEKMASLGELTAGIAHEIQNPLNFVNNFSDVSRELLGEMKEELAAGNMDDVIDIAASLDQNLEKISLHGKRAENIVKGMLEHSRASTGIKEPTDLNKLTDEYLKLSYHGLRAKDKNFNVELVTHFDNSLPQATIVQQDMGRVLLNLFNNAFYAVNEKKKTAGDSYKPEVTISTFTPPSGGWGVSVQDNGNGIPDAIKDKIMQPFFTTKPTGQGTGLGLSLSYDIIVKGHSGMLNVTSKEGEFTKFEVLIPG